MKFFKYNEMDEKQQKAFRVIVKRFGTILVLYLISFIWWDAPINSLGGVFHVFMATLLGSSIGWAWIGRKHNLFRFFLKEYEDEEKNLESTQYKSLDLSKLLYSGKVISTEEALKDVEPIEWSEDVLSVKKKVSITKAEPDT